MATATSASKQSSSTPSSQSQAPPPQTTEHAPEASASHKKRASSVFWIKLNFTVKTARLQSLKRHKYQHLQEEALLRARGLLKNWEDGPVLLIEDLYRQAARRGGGGDADDEDARELRNYTPEALALRFSLRNDPKILGAARELWLIDTGPRDALGCIDQRAYTALFRRIAKCVDARPIRAHRKRRTHVEKTIFEDWIRDSKGEPEMSFANFFDSVFELADLWCETINIDEYVTFLERVHRRISEKRAKGSGGNRQRVLRPLKRVKPLDAESSDESSTSDEESEEESNKDESDEFEENVEVGQPEPPFLHSSLAHRSDTERHIFDTEIAELQQAPAATGSTVAINRKAHSVTGLLGSLPTRSASPGSITSGSSKSNSVRFLSAAYQQQRILKMLQPQQRSSAVGTVRFGDDSIGGDGIIGAGQLESGSSSNDLSALVEGAGFQSGTEVRSAMGDSRRSLLLRTQSDNNSSSGRAGSDTVLSSSEKKSPLLSSLSTDAQTSSGDNERGSEATGSNSVGNSKSAEASRAQPRTPMVSVHVIESGIDGIINSSSAHPIASPSDTKGYMSTAARNAIVNLTQSAQSPKPNRVGFCSVVFNAMHSSQSTSEEQARHDGSTSASHIHNLGLDRYQVAELNNNSSSEPSRSGLMSSPTFEIETRNKPQAVSIGSSTAIEPQQQQAAFASSTTAKAYPLTGSSYTTTSSYSAVLSTHSTSRSSTGPAHARHSRDRKRVLPPMSPMQQTLYRLDQESRSNGTANRNKQGQVDLTSSYSTMSYISDPSKDAVSNSSVAQHESVGIAVDTPASLLDAHAKSSSDTASPWFGRHTPNKEFERRAARGPRKRSTTTALQSVDIDTANGGGNMEHRSNTQGRSAANQSSFRGEILDTSSCDTFEKDDSGTDDFTLEGWLDPSPPFAEDSPSSLLAPNKSRQRRKARKNKKRCSNSKANADVKNSTDVESRGRLPMAVTSLGSPVTRLSKTEFGRHPNVSTGNYSGGVAQLGSSASTPILHDNNYYDRLDMTVLGSSSSGILTAHLPQSLSPSTSHSSQRQSHHCLETWREDPVHSSPLGSALADLEMRGERKIVIPSSRPLLDSSFSTEQASGVGDNVHSRALSPLRYVTAGVSCTCSRSELRPDCTFEHCEAARSRLQTAPAELASMSHNSDWSYVKFPVVKMERQQLASSENSDANHVDGDVANGSRSVEKGVTIVLNAKRELILQPRRAEDEVVDEGKKLLPTRSEMMKRRYRYTFGKP